jgi:hypothetical protein
MKRIYWIIIVGVVLVASVIVVKVAKGNKPTDVYTEKATVRDIIEIVSATGKVQPETELKISSDVSGEITEMMVKEGDQVKTIRFGQQGEKGSPDGSARNKAFKARHAKNIAKGKMSAAWWSNKIKW